MNFMFTINKSNNITIIQGDTGIIHIDLDNYDLVNGDQIIFAIASNITEPALVKKVVKEFEPDGSAKIVIDAADTLNLPAGNYLYEIEVTTQDGRVDTIIPVNKFIIKEGLINE